MPTLVFAEAVGPPSPKFGTSCVCCNADAGGVTASRTVRSHESSRRNIELEVPVCSECVPHVFEGSGAAYAVPAALVAGLGALGAGGYDLVNGHGDVQQMLLVCVGGALVTSGGVLGSIYRKSQLEQLRERGHAPGLNASVYLKQLVLSTTTRS